MKEEIKRQIEGINSLSNIMLGLVVIPVLVLGFINKNTWVILITFVLGLMLFAFKTGLIRILIKLTDNLQE